MTAARPDRAWNDTPRSRGPATNRDTPPACGCGAPFPLYRTTIGGQQVRVCAACDRALRHKQTVPWVEQRMMADA